MIGKLDVDKLRKDYPILHQEVNGHPLVYLDNAASSQKPDHVVNAITDYYRSTHSNVHRGSHQLAAQATEQFEAARETARNFVNAASTEEINFVKGTTDGINLVAFSFGDAFVKEGDQIIVSEMDHHSNIVPWQMLCRRKKAELKVIPVSDNGELILEELEELLKGPTKVVAINYISNALGTINPVKEIVRMAHASGAKVMLDAAQAAPHLAIDVQELNCDFLAISGHKMYGPTGIGVLYGKKELLNAIPPYQGGGEMISSVSFDGTSYNDLPYKFEAGTPNIAGAIGIAAAMDYISNIGIEKIGQWEKELLDHGTNQLSQIDGLQIYGTTDHKAGVISFLLEGAHAYDLATLLNQQGIAVRDGHHCCEPLMHRFGIEGTCRASFALYNTLEEVDRLAEAVEKARNILS